MAVEGASLGERFINACRNRTADALIDILKEASQEIVDATAREEAIAKLINTATGSLGSHGLHIAAEYGRYYVLEELLDHEGVEVDPIDPISGDTPLHKAVRHINEKVPKSEWRSKDEVVEILTEAGADPRIRNKGKLKASDLVDPSNQELRTILQKAEYAITLGDDVVNQDEAGDGPPSDSD